jgi:hypothetical protein
LFQFTSGATATTLTLPDDIKWANDDPPTIAENMIYQVSILKGMASILGFSNTSDSTFPVTLIVGDNADRGVNVYLALEEGVVLNSGDLILIVDNVEYSVTTYEYTYGMSAEGYNLLHLGSGVKQYDYILSNDGYVTKSK